MTPTWPYPILRLKPGKEALLSKRHPWVFSGALQDAPQASLIRLADASGNVLAVGTASPTNPLAISPIHHRGLLSFNDHMRCDL